MPTNVSQGDTVQFTVEFFDASGTLTVPTSGTLSIAYTDTSGSTAAATVGLTPSGSFFTGSWDSTPAALGFASWSVTAPGEATNPAASGQLRIIG